MKRIPVLLSIILAIGPFLEMRDAVAQVPPHAPGTICFTPQFWCWANPPGPPGGACYCPSPFGWVPGRLN